MKQTRRDGRRSRVALMLLVLVAYASLIGATHHHGKVGEPASDSGISSRDNKDSNGAPSSGDASDCATCRLQRNFDSALRSPSVLFDLRPQSLGYEICPCDRHLPGACVVFSSRGPPLA